MRRKVALIGPATLMISLPSKWAKRFGIKKGDELDLKENGSSLVVGFDKANKIERTSIDVSELSEQVIKWTLSALHKSGYDEIEVKYSDKKTLSVVQEMVKNVLMGFAIMDQNDKRVILRCVAQDVSTEFDAALRRAFLVTLALGENSLNLLKNNKFNELKELIALEQTNNQLTNFCERILNKRGIGDERAKSFLYVTVWNLEKLCDHYKDICNLDINKVNRETLDLYKEVNALFNNYYEIFYKFDLNKLRDLETSAKDLSSKSGKIKNDRELAHCLSNIISGVRNFFASTIALNQFAKSDS